jgi:LysM repeat protein
MAPATPATIPAPITPAPVAPPATTDSKEVVVAAGDTLGAIAHKNGMTLKALMDANPGVNPKKLQIGQKLQVPAGASSVASAATPAGTALAPDVASGDVAVYVVKSGDTLSKIAKSHHTSFKKIMALNDLKTSSIRIGQKLKLSAAKAVGTETPATSASTAVVPLQSTPSSVTTASTTPATAAN